MISSPYAWKQPLTKLDPVEALQEWDTASLEIAFENWSSYRPGWGSGDLSAEYQRWANAACAELLARRLSKV